MGLSHIGSTPVPPDLTPYIVKNGDQYLAGGSFGDVYRCRYIIDSSEKEVAVKAFRFKLTMTGKDGDDRAGKMIRRELGIWKRLEHKNIVPFLGIAYGFGMCGTMSLVSLWMPKGTLREFLAEHDSTLTLERRLQLLLDIANGLDYLHSFSICPIIHGDLNCNNVLLDADNTARLTDFGYASLIGDIPEALAYLQMSTSQPGAMRWAAPEKVLPGETNNRTTKSDIYSFGCISLQVLSGKLPWSEVQKDSYIVLLLAQGQKPRRPDSHPIMGQHWDLIQKCWLSVGERPPAKKIIAYIKAFLTDLQPQSLRKVATSRVIQSKPATQDIPLSVSFGLPGCILDRNCNILTPWNVDSCPSTSYTFRFAGIPFPGWYHAHQDVGLSRNDLPISFVDRTVDPLSHPHHVHNDAVQSTFTPPPIPSPRISTTTLRHDLEQGYPLRSVTCRWQSGPRCDGLAPDTNSGLRDHLQTLHCFIGHERDVVQCEWENCGQTMQRMNVPRHIVSRHILFAISCRFCKKRFSRPDTVTRHERTCGENVSVLSSPVSGV